MDKIFKPLSHFGKQPSNRGVAYLWWVGKYMSHHFKKVTEDIRQSCTSMTKTVNVLLFLTAIHTAQGHNSDTYISICISITCIKIHQEQHQDNKHQDQYSQQAFPH